MIVKTITGTLVCFSAADHKSVASCARHRANGTIIQPHRRANPCM